MARRGQCRCGLVLTFHRTAHGYKMRCPSCGAVVRLRVQGKHPQAAAAPPDEIDVELVELSELPDAAGSEAAPMRRGLLVGVAIGAVAGLGVVTGVVWWLLH